MNKIELSIWIEASYPANKSSIANRKAIFGVGENDAHYATNPMVNCKHIQDPAYKAWVSMLTRAYSQRYHAAYPTYSDVTVCKEWHSFSAFRAWWLANYREDWQLDKDMLSPGNREYGPDACIYIPGWLNSFTVDCGSSRGELPIGVTFCNQTGRYRSKCRNPITGKQRTIGRFATPEEASAVWRRYKLELADQLKPAIDAIDKRIYTNVVTIVKALS